ncbi:MAG TPA: family 1 glycosylhydrolase [Candidatus Sulfotelmatobacter sp.]|nr:family 1 glycosylhydrolase [Candidatus Sulfotelmatobacter sp.]
MPALSFPPGFRWGTAMSAHQVEGGNRLNDWWRFEQIPGAIADGDRSGDACRHYELFDQDFALAEADGHNMHRLSIEWSRLEPERDRWNAAEVEHYHQVLASLKRHRITPLVTLHHFTNPCWIADRGGWENPETIDRYCEYVRFCAREFGGEVDWWCTVNEPEVYAFRGMSEAVWPPRKRDDGAALCVIGNLLEAHGRAYRVLHEEDRADADGDGFSARVGFAKHRPQLVAANPWSPLDALRAAIENQMFNVAVESAQVTGMIDLSIPGAPPVRREVPELKDAFDWYGLNYYTRWMVHALGREAHTARVGAPRNDLHWEIWAEGLAEAAHAAARAGKPILITEHGIADARDQWRPKFISDSLAALARVIQSGADVIGYLHWSLLDNFEWSDGYRGRFGLYAVDFNDATKPRRRRESAEVFARIVRANAVEPAPAS